MSENNLNNETQSTESKINKFKQEVKRLMPKHPKLVLLVIIICAVVVVLLAGSALVLKIIDGTEDSLLDAVSSLISSLSISTNGTISSSTSVQDLWDELMENTDSRVAEYLDSPEQLARLIYAELLTQNVDTREDPDEEIIWDEVIDDFVGESSDDEDDDDEEDDEESVESVAEIQGIIKFKRATQETDEEGNAVSETMVYVDNETFYDWIEIYSESGDVDVEYNGETVSVLDCLMTHYTLGSTETTTTSNADRYTTTLSYSDSDLWTDISAQIVEASAQVASPGSRVMPKVGKTGIC